MTKEHELIQAKAILATQELFRVRRFIEGCRTAGAFDADSDDIAEEVL